MFGKNKNGYLIPISLNVKPVYNALKDATEFFGLFKREKILKNYAFL